MQVNVKFFGTDSQVGLIVNHDFERVKTVYINPLSDVELTLVYQKRPFNVLLDDLWAHCSFRMPPNESFSQLVKTKNSDSPRVVAGL
jgi:hypothetical protein